MSDVLEVANVFGRACFRGCKGQGSESVEANLGGADGGPELMPSVATGSSGRYGGDSIGDEEAF